MRNVSKFKVTEKTQNTKLFGVILHIELICEVD